MSTNLTYYRQQTRRLLNDFNVAKFVREDLDVYINEGRSQIAAEGECIRVPATLATVNATQNYAFSSISIATSGVSSTITVRNITGLNAGGNQALLINRNWDWFSAFYLGGGTSPASANPKWWSQQGRGSSGTLWFYPIPNGVQSLTLDIAGLPISLALDSDAEAIPYPWTDAIPFYAAYKALLSIEQEDPAAQMFAQFEIFMRRSVDSTAPSVLPVNHPGGPGAQVTGAKTPLIGQLGGKG